MDEVKACLNNLCQERGSFFGVWRCLGNAVIHGSRRRQRWDPWASIQDSKQVCQ